MAAPSAHGTLRVGFLRAVNLGKRRVTMSRLVEVCERLGYEDVWTYVNSGNVVFAATDSRAALEHALAKALEDERRAHGEVAALAL